MASVAYPTLRLNPGSNQQERDAACLRYLVERDRYHRRQEERRIRREARRLLADAAGRLDELFGRATPEGHYQTGDLGHRLTTLVGLLELYAGHL